jgi:hypothetical protein
MGIEQGFSPFHTPEHMRAWALWHPRIFATELMSKDTDVKQCLLAYPLKGITNSRVVHRGLEAHST